MDQSGQPPGEESVAYVNQTAPKGPSLWQKAASSKLLKIGMPLLLLALLPVVVILSQQRQETRSKASAATVISFTPQSSHNHPIRVKRGNDVTLNIVVDPGTNLVSNVALEITYDPKYLAVENPSKLQIDPNILPQVMSQPAISNGQIRGTFSIGADATKAIRARTQIGTLTLKGIKRNDGKEDTVVRFGPATRATSLGENDQFNENVLSNTIPAIINVNRADNDRDNTPLPVVSVTSRPPTTVPTGASSSAVVQSTAPVCTPANADLNKDGRVDNADFTFLANCYNKTPISAACQVADIGKDGKVDIADYNCVLRGGQ